MSGYTEVVSAIRVWSHVNERPGTAMSDPDHVAGSSRRPRADSGASIGASTAPESSDMPAFRKGKERASSMVSVASEKARLFRTSLENGLRGGRSSVVSPVNSSSNVRSDSLPSDGDSTTPSGRPDLSIVPTPTTDSDNPSSGLPSPFPMSPPCNSPLDVEGPSLANELLKTPLTDQDSPGGPSPSTPSSNNQRSSRRPSLPSILEKAAHPGIAFRSAMRKTEKDSSPSITESEQNSATPPPPSGMFSRGRARTVETLQRTKSQKRAILGLFRRGQSPHSRSPSPPRKIIETAPRPAATEQLEESIALLKRASMDPEMMQMALAVVQLGDQLEAAAAISAPVTKTHFFDDLPASPSSYSVSSDRQASRMPPPPSIERGWDPRRGRNGVAGVISPSPLANTWGDESDGEPRRASVRRSVTDVVRKSKDVPRRMPSLPAMAGSITKRRSRVLPNGTSPPTDVSAGPTSDSSFIESDEALCVNSSTPATEPSPHEEKPKFNEEEEEDPDVTITAPPTSVPSLTLGSAEDGAASEAADLHVNSDSHALAEVDMDGRRFRGESVSSQLTETVITPPSSRMMTPPGSAGHRIDPDMDLRSLGLLPVSPETQSKERTTALKAATLSTLGSGLPSERVVPSSLPSERPLGSRRSPLQRSASQRSTATLQRSTSQRSTSQRSILDGPIPEGRPLSPPHRKISNHAEARDAMEQDERDILSIAQMPHSELSSRSLADQLAAYGESHALAQEFARVERLSSVSSGSDRRFQRHSTMSTGSTTTSQSGVDNINHRSSVSSFASSKAGLTPIDPSITRIYDRRADAYRERMQALASVPSMNGIQKRSMTNGSRSRATSASDMWLTAGPHATASAAHPRRLTDPTGTTPEDIDQHPNISGPLPMVSDLQRVRKNSANGSRKPTMSSIKAGVSSGPSPRGSLQTSVLGSTPRRTGHLSRASSLSMSDNTRYQGLAQARAYAAHSSSVVGTSSIMASRQPHPRSDTEEDEDELEPPEPAFNVVEVSQWQNGLEGSKAHNKWGQFKGAIGHLRR